MNRILLISFLHRLRASKPWLFLFAVSAIFLQVFFTFFKLEATPFFLYGMFSEKIPVTDTFSITQILVNDRPLEDYGSPLRERDLLQSTAENFEEMKNNHYVDPLRTRIESRYPFIYRSRLYPFFSRHMYNSRPAMDEYRGWLRKKCLDIAGLSEGSVKMVRTTLLLDKNALRLKPVKNEVLEDL